MKWATIILVVCFAFVARDLKHYLDLRRNNAEMSQALGEGDGTRAVTQFGFPAGCLDKSYCISIFIAPWCSVCKASLPAIQTLNKMLPSLRPDVGLGIVIGSASIEDCQAQQYQISPLASQIDSSGNILRARKIAGFPTWIVNSRDGQELYRRSGGVQVSNDDGVSQFLTMILADAKVQ